MSSSKFSDDENEIEENEEPKMNHPKQKLKKLMNKKNHTEEEAEEDEEGSDKEKFLDSSDEDEDEPNQYQYDDFVVGDEESEDDSKKRRKEKRKKRVEGEEGGSEGGSEGEGNFSDTGSNGEESGSEEEGEEEEEQEDPEAAKKRREERRKKREEKKRKKAERNKKLSRLKRLREPDSDQEDIGEAGDGMDGFVVGSKKNGIERGSIHGDIFGYDEEEEEDMGYGDEEDNDQLMLEDKVKDKLAMIREQYEPSLLEEKHFTDADEEIRNKNQPERLQRRKGTPYTGEQDALEEAQWIYEVAFDNNNSSSNSMNNSEKAIEAIAQILKFIQQDQLEIPFIYTYEKDIYEPYFTLQDLWNIFDLDEKWAHIKLNKKNLEAMGKSNKLIESYDTILKESRTEESVSDLYDLFQVLNAIERSNSDSFDIFSQNNNSNNNNSGTNSNGEPKQKRAIKRDLYTIYTKAGLSKFLSNFGMSAREFGQNLMDNYTTNKPKDMSTDPSTAALGHICIEADSMDRVLQATRYMMAQEIGYDPHVRYSVRMIYRKYAHITTTPTIKGFKEVDVFHPYFTVKSIQEKPAHLFDDSQYLLILKAEKEGFIKSTMAISEKTHNSVIIPEMEALYLSDGTSSITQQWNEQRKLIIREALTKFLYPVLEKELRNKLLTEASNRVAFECAKKLEDKIRVAPWKPLASNVNLGHSNSRFLFGGSRQNNGYNNSQDDDDDDEVEYDRDGNPIPFKILSLCWGADKIPTMGAILNSDGEVVSHVKLDFICDRLGESLKDKKEKDIKKLEDLCLDHQPRLVVVSATEMDSKRLFEEIKTLIERWCTGERRIMRKSCLVNYYNSEIGLSLQTSSRMEEEFKEYPPILRHAIAVGRCVLDPLTEYSSLCTDHNEILFLKLHPLQDMIGKDYLVKLLHRCFINVVNAVGVDINRMIQCRFTSSTLQFVSGLGSRKSQMILNNLFRRGGYVTSRASLSKILNQDIVYKNCIGFIQIRERYTAEYKSDLLDDTRIHPDNYPISYRIAAEALDKPLEDRYLQSYIEDIMKKPKKLDRLDLDAFADILEKHDAHPAHKLLHFIKKELTHPFADIRHPYEEPTADQIFEWLTGETESTFRIGTLVTVTTIRNFDNSVKCRLDNGLEGSIPSDSLSDDGSIKSLNRGVTINCRIISIDKANFSVKLSCKPSDISPTRWEDSIFRELKQNGQNQYLRLEETPPPEQQKKKVVRKEKRPKRTVVHPLWHDFSCIEAENYLSDKPIGEVILRPSSKGFDHITATFKFGESIYLHHDIKEADKPNAVSLGKSFYMGDTKYDSLDEILARHVEYLINNLNEVKGNTAHWKDGNRSDIDTLIRAEKVKNPKTIPYYFGYDYEHPGFLTLYHVPSSTPRHEPILVKADGFILRKKLYSTYYELIKYFKRNYAQLLQASSSSSSNNSSSSSSSSSGSANQQSQQPLQQQSNHHQQQAPRTPSRSGSSSYNQPRPPPSYNQPSSSSYNQPRPPSQPYNQPSQPYNQPPQSVYGNSMQQPYNQQPSRQSQQPYNQQPSRGGWDQQPQQPYNQPLQSQQPYNNQSYDRRPPQQQPPQQQQQYSQYNQYNQPQQPQYNQYSQNSQQQYGMQPPPPQQYNQALPPQQQQQQQYNNRWGNNPQQPPPQQQWNQQPPPQQQWNQQQPPQQQWGQQQNWD